MKLKVLLFVVFIQLAHFATSQVNLAKLRTVNTEYGQVQGIAKTTILGRNYVSFQSIPYMKPPVGKLRFRDPEPPNRWVKPLDATKEPPAYTQIDFSFTQTLIGQEDAGVINVYTPWTCVRDRPRLPVLVFIHGGSFHEYSSKTELFGPDFFLQKDIIIVTFNYRLGVIGFLNLQDRNLKVPGNAGLKDQAFALRWVQRNIENFGGDRDRVTVFGESAGGASVHLHMLSEQSRNLFKRAITFSGAAQNPWVFPPIKNLGQRIGMALGFNGTTEAQLLAFLEERSAVELVFAKNFIRTPEEIYGELVDISAGPVIEPSWSNNAFIKLDPVIAARTAWGNNIDAIFGVNSFEGLFQAFREYIDGGYNINQVINYFNGNSAYFAPLPNLKLSSSDPNAKIYGQRIKDLYFNGANVSLDNLAIFYRFLSDYGFVHGNYRAVQSRLKYGPVSAKSYMSRFDFQSVLNFFKIYIARRGEDGATHADDFFYYFKNKFTPQITIPSPEYSMIQIMVDLITSFAIDGTPTVDLTPLWEPVKKADAIPQVLNIANNNLTMIPLPEFSQIQVFNEIYKEAKVDLI